MKKLIGIVVMLMVGMGVAYASSMSVPWFVDMDTPNSGAVPTQEGGPFNVVGIVRLKNNTPDVMTCEIEYYNADGLFLGPPSDRNTFTVAPNSALAFRPVAIDPVAGLTYNGYNAFGELVTIEGTPGGQEQSQGVLVPVRPRGEDPMPNGSITIRWVGTPTDVQGIFTQIGGGPLTGMCFSVLLPPGA